MKAYCPSCKATLRSESAASCPTCGKPCLPGGGWPRDAWLGEQVDGGKYLVEQLLGSGGFGRVYAVRHTLIEDRRFAMKVLHRGVAGDPEHEKQFLAEIKLLMGFDHPHIVKCHEVGWLEDGSLFVLMELIAGDDLNQWLKSHGPMAPARVARIGAQIADALDAAHERGVLHRDLKPHNVLMVQRPDAKDDTPSGDDEIRVIDFGIAKVLGGGTEGHELSQVIGTPSYMAPEQFLKGCRVDGRLDIYQLGAILYTLLTHEPPYAPPENADSLVALVDIMRQQERHKETGIGPRPSARVPKLTAQAPALDEVIARMLATDRDQRPTTAEEARVLLERCLSDPASADLDHDLPERAPDKPHDDGVEGSSSATQSARLDSATPKDAPNLNPSRLPVSLVAGLVLGALLAVAVGVAVSQSDPPAPPAASNAKASATPAPKTPDAPAAKAPKTAKANPKGATNAPKAGTKADAKAAKLPKNFIPIRPGTFTMGSPEGEAGRKSDERAREVTLTQPFAIEKTEVTQRAWIKVMGNDPAYFDACGKSCPIEQISWFDALAYLNKRSERDGLEACYVLGGCEGTPGGGCDPKGKCEGDYVCKTATFKGKSCTGYRLPTEAEWEYAARAGNTDARYGPSDDIAWTRTNSGTKTGLTTHKVGVKQPNAWGLHDTLGGVFEWVWDGYGEYPMSAEDAYDENDMAHKRTARGGSWANNPGVSRFATRLDVPPRERSYLVGLRAVRSISADLLPPEPPKTDDAPSPEAPPSAPTP